MASPTSPDIEWVLYTLRELEDAGRGVSAWALLRPTSPLRSAKSIVSALKTLVRQGDQADSIRAVEPVRQHPGKMWVIDGDYITPLLPQLGGGVPTHSRQFHDLPPVYVQDSSLEISWSHVALSGGGIAGTRVLPWWPPGFEGLAIDYPEDWERLEKILSTGEATLPAVSRRLTA
jgi:CMP-N-acetylneuraminic acid synthetase